MVHERQRSDDRGDHDDGPLAAVRAPDGALWFTNRHGDSIGQIGVNGSVRTYGSPRSDLAPVDMELGPDGALWFTDPTNNSIGRISTDGVVRTYSGPGIDRPAGTRSLIGRLTRDGRIGTFTNPGIRRPHGITVGADGALWFADDHSIGRITTDGAVTTYAGITYPAKAAITTAAGRPES